MAGRDYSGRGVEPRLRVRNCTNYALYWDQRFREVVVAQIGIFAFQDQTGRGLCGVAYTYLAQVACG